MKSSVQKRLKQLESRLGINKRHKSARIVCDPKIMHSFDFSEVSADVLLILPDNGRGHTAMLFRKVLILFTTQILN